MSNAADATTAPELTPSVSDSVAGSQKSAPSDVFTPKVGKDEMRIYSCSTLAPTNTLDSSAMADACSLSCSDTILDAKEVDVESAKGEDAVGSTITSRKRRNRRMICCSVCTIAFLAFSAAATVFLYPKYPEWEIKELTFTKEAKEGLLRAFTQPSFSATETFEGIDAVAEFYNGNHLGTEALSGEFSIWFGDYNIGTAYTEPARVPARSSVQMKSTCKVVITPEVAGVLLESVLANNFIISTRVTGVLPARVFGLFTVQTQVECDIESEALKLLSDTNTMVKSHVCKYSFTL